MLFSENERRTKNRIYNAHNSKKLKNLSERYFLGEIYEQYCEKNLLIFINTSNSFKY